MKYDIIQERLILLHGKHLMPSQEPETIVNLVIDVHDYSDNSKMGKAEHDRYIKKIKDSIEALRDRGIPTIYIAIGDASIAFPGSPNRDPSLPNLLGLSEIAPKPGDDIFLKLFMSGFIDKADVDKSPVLKAYVIGQRPEDGENYAKAEFSKLTLRGLLERKGATHVTLMGEAAQFCITDNAIDAVRNGLGVTILSDAVAGWTDETYKAKNWRDGKMTWPEGDPAYHERQIKRTLDEIRANPAARGLADNNETREAINTVAASICPVAKFLESLPTPKAAQPSAGNKPARPAAHKPA